MNIMKRYTSRKFIMALLGVLTGVGTALSNLGGNVGTIAGLVVTTASILTYIYTEGKIDAENKQIALDIQKITEEIIDVLNRNQTGGQ